MGIRITKTNTGVIIANDNDTDITVSRPGEDDILIESGDCTEIDLEGDNYLDICSCDDDKPQYEKDENDEDE